MLDKFIKGNSIYDVTYRIGNKKYEMQMEGKSVKDVRNSILAFFNSSGIKIKDLNIILNKESFKENLTNILEGEENL